jgi:hypothetical protein
MTWKTNEEMMTLYNQTKNDCSKYERTKFKSELENFVSPTILKGYI